MRTIKEKAKRLFTLVLSAILALQPITAYAATDGTTEFFANSKSNVLYSTSDLSELVVEDTASGDLVIPLPVIDTNYASDINYTDNNITYFNNLNEKVDEAFSASDEATKANLYREIFTLIADRENWTDLEAVIANHNTLDDTTLLSTPLIDAATLADLLTKKDNYDTAVGLTAYKEGHTLLSYIITREEIITIDGTLSYKLMYVEPVFQKLNVYYGTVDDLAVGQELAPNSMIYSTENRMALFFVKAPDNSTYYTPVTSAGASSLTFDNTFYSGMYGSWQGYNSPNLAVTKLNSSYKGKPVLSWKITAIEDRDNYDPETTPMGSYSRVKYISLNGGSGYVYMSNINYNYFVSVEPIFDTLILDNPLVNMDGYELSITASDPRSESGNTDYSSIKDDIDLLYFITKDSNLVSQTPDDSELQIYNSADSHVLHEGTYYIYSKSEYDDGIALTSSTGNWTTITVDKPVLNTPSIIVNNNEVTYTKGNSITSENGNIDYSKYVNNQTLYHFITTDATYNSSTINTDATVWDNVTPDTLTTGYNKAFAYSTLTIPASMLGDAEITYSSDVVSNVSYLPYHIERPTIHENPYDITISNDGTNAVARNAEIVYVYVDHEDDTYGNMTAEELDAVAQTYTGPINKTLGISKIYAYSVASEEIDGVEYKSYSDISTQPITGQYGVNDVIVNYDNTNITLTSGGYSSELKSYDTTAIYYITAATEAEAQAQSATLVDDANKYTGPFERGTGDYYIAAVEVVTSDSGDGVRLDSRGNITYTYIPVTPLTITYDGNGGTPSRATDSKTFDQPYGDLATATRTGYTFGSWTYTDTEGNPVAIDENTVVALNVDHVLTATWNPINYLVRYNAANGATGTMNDSTIAYDDTVELADNAFTKTYTATLKFNDEVTADASQAHNAEFLGWSTDAASTTVTYENKEPVTNLSDTADTVINLYTVWGNAKFTLPTPTKQYYTCTGWSDGTTTYNCGEEVSINSDITLNAIWVQNSNTVYFNPNNGECDVTSKTVSSGDLYGELPTATRENHSFLGWFTELLGGSEITAESVKSVEGDETLYAHWYEDDYTLTFDANGGSVSVASKTVRNGEAYGDLPTPTRENYNFLGWFTGADGGAEVKADTIKSTSGNETVYAHWKERDYTLTFDANGGIVSPTTKTVRNGEVYGALPTPTRENHSFLGWFTAADGGTEITADTTKSTSSDETLYAHWYEDDYTLTFDPNGGNVDPTTKTVRNGEAYGDLPVPTLEDYVFIGWFTLADGGTEVTANTVKSTSGNETVYAHWKYAHDYTVTFDPNGGTVSITSIIVRKDTAYGSLPTPVLEGYDFVGWFTAVDGGTEVKADTIKTTATDETLFAHWVKSTYRLTFDANGGEVNPTSKDIQNGEVYGELPVPTKEGYNFLGWFTAIDGGTEITADTVKSTNGNETVYAHWDGKTYNVSFNTNGGIFATDGIMTISDTDSPVLSVKLGEVYGELPVVVRNNHTFTGWFTALEGGTEITADTVKTTIGDETLYAHWNENDYTLTFDPNGGTVNPTTKTVRRTEAYGDLPTPVREGYNFLGWFTSETGGTEITATTIKTEAGNETVYAHWSTAAYRVTFDANGGTVNPASKAVIKDTAYGELPTPVREGYKFIGWFTAKDGGTEVKATTIKTTDGDETLYAHWNVVYYNVKFDPNGGTTNAVTKSLRKGDVYGTLPDATRNGCEFLGWYTAKDGGNKVEATTVKNTAADETLYAHWREKSYVVKFDANGGVGTMNNITVSLNSQLTLPANTFTRAGYTFLGWSTNKLATTSSYADKAVISPLTTKESDVVTLYAVWSKNVVIPTPPDRIQTSDDFSALPFILCFALGCICIAGAGYMSYKNFKKEEDDI